MALFFNRRNKFSNNQNGWIYIDALIGMLILSIGLTALAMSYRQTTITGTSSVNYYQATLIGQQVLEEFRKNDGVKAAAADFTFKNPDPVNGITYTVSVEKINVTKIKGLVDANLLVPYKVTVSWSEGTSKDTHSIEIVSYYYLSP